MESKKIFLVTVFQGDNFGSSLQAFALKEYILNSFSVECTIVNRKDEGLQKFFYLLKRKFVIFLKTLLYPSQFKKTWASHLNKNKIKNTYNLKIHNRFLEFSDNILKVNSFSYTKLKKQSKSSDCLLCLCGSDQIWNPTNLYLSETNFLAFAPKDKRFSYSCSLGVDSIPRYNKRKLNHYLQKFSKISVRENDAAKILESEFSLHATVCIDPTILVGKQFWSKYIKKIDHSYDFLYFLNKPSIDVINNLNNYYTSNKKTIIVLSKNDIDFSFDYEPISDCDPFLFLSFIANADTVFTDSYHGTILSTLFNVKFLTFKRNYGTNVQQNSRIFNFLASANLNNCYIEEDHFSIFDRLDKINFSSANRFLNESRIASMEYLKGIFLNAK